MHRSTPRPHSLIAPRVLFALSLTVGLLGSLSVTSTARAATIAVTTTVDEFGTGTACSLREAIHAANIDTAFGGCATGSGADTITLPAGTYLLTRAGIDDDVNATGDLDITSNLTITGANQTTTFIDANKLDRVVQVAGGATVVLANVTLRNGDALNDESTPGVGIQNAGTLTLTSSTVSGNTSLSASVGIDNTGTLTLTNSTVSNNESYTGHVGITNFGGAARLTITDSVITSNSSGYGTTGISNGGTFTIANSTISGNRTAKGGTSGISNGGTFTLTNSTVHNNSGTAIRMGGRGNITGSSIRNNSNYNGTGAINNGGHLTLTNSTVANNGGATNYQDAAAGALLNSGTVTVTTSTISGNGVILYSEEDLPIEQHRAAGAFYNRAGSVTLTNSTISGNSARSEAPTTFAGGIMNADGGTVTLANSTVHNNRTEATSDPPSPNVRASVCNLGGTMQLRNTIVANSVSPGTAECGGPLTSQGYNLVQHATTCTLTGTTTGNKLNVDPKLGSLADNGGATFTHALLAGSPAMDAANPGTPGSGTACATKDQRGVVRPQDGNADGTSRCDIGAVERERATIASDPFSRTTTNGWGSATTGGAYTITGTAANYGVATDAGTQRLPTAGTGTAALLPQAQVLNADMRVRVKTDKLAAGAAQYAYLVLRNVGTTTEYRAQLRLEVGGSVQGHLIRSVNNQETTLGTITRVPNVTHKANTYLWVRAQVVGSTPATVRIKVWADGQAEPAAWLVTATDTTPALQAPGGVGLRAFVSPKATNAPVRVTFDDLQVTSMQP